MSAIDALCWPAASVVVALEATARHAGLPLEKAADAAQIWGAAELSGPDFDRWVVSSAGWLGLDAQPIDVEYPDVEALLFRAAPALIRVQPQGALLALLGRRGQRVSILTSDLEVRHVPVAVLRTALCERTEAKPRAGVEEWLSELIADPKARVRARDALVAEALESAVVARCYLLRMPAGASFWAQLRFEGLLRRAVALMAAHAAQLLLALAAWYTLGAGVFTGRMDRDWLIAWALLLVTSIPIQVFTSWTQAQILVGIGVVLKRRLLVGTLRVDQDALRREGAGQLLGRALDANALEAMALSGGVFAALALIELAVLAFVLLAGPGGTLQAVVFAAWWLLTLAVGWQSYTRTLRTTRARRELTSDLVEQMIGHRTRLAQQRPSHWHDGEDEALDRYLGLATGLDRRDALLRAIPRIWYFVGLATLLPSLLGDTASTGALAVAVGAMLLGGGALLRMSSGLTQVAVAATCWREVKPLFDAAARPVIQPSPVFVAAHLQHRAQSSAVLALPGRRAAAEVPLIDATDLAFSYPGRPQPVLRSGTLRVAMGDRILVEGPSGGGKSTLASLLSGMRKPDAGLLLLEGLDWQTVGPEGWRRRVAAAPQYHDNHVLSETFLFNVLMGRQWPPTPQDIREAEEVCAALGLGPLLERMPAGMMQMVGESGWRLSHGERSRVFIARTLLQGAKVILLDESFAALDPATLEQCLGCVLQRAPALIVIAHP